MYINNYDTLLFNYKYPHKNISREVTAVDNWSFHLRQTNIETSMFLSR